MFAVDQIIFVTAILLLIGIASSKFSSRIGLPVLVLFLVVGMLAGSEGIGGIDFENIPLAHGIGTVALAIILYDGGMRTSVHAFRMVLWPALLLATLGVLLTAMITGLAASWIAGLTLLHGLLLGSIVGSTDAAAVFSVLRAKGLNLKERLAALLEVESASNDPMAIFLTVGLLQILLGEMELGFGLFRLFLLQMSIGALVGVVMGKATVWVVNRVDLDAAGLYPVLTAAAGLLAFGLAAVIGGSGFLAVYLAGIVIGNSRIVFQRGILHFHDGAAWLSQIAMFVLLGLLAFPSRLAGVATEGLLIAGVLIFIARPVAVGLMLPWFGFNVREVALVSWVGLKGAVPIVLATFPLLLGLEGSDALFDIIFFVVLVSAVLQGWSLPPVARILGLQTEPKPEPPISLEITSLRDVEQSRASGRSIRELALPDGAVVAMVVRDQQIIPPRGSTRIEPGDHVFLVLRPAARPLVDQLFSHNGETVPDLPLLVEFPLRGDTTVSELEEFYGIRLDAEATQTLDELLRARLGTTPRPDDTVTVSGVSLTAKQVVEGRVEQVGLTLSTLEPDDEPEIESHPDAV